MSKNTNYDILDKILADADRHPGSGGKVWVPSENHPNRGYWASPEDAAVTWDKLKEVDKIERYLLS